MLEQILISIAIAITSGSLIMFGMVALFRHKVKFLNVLFINIAADIAAGVLEIYTEPLITRGIVILLTVILLKHFTEIKSWISLLFIAVLTNICVSVIVFGTMEMVIIPWLNNI